MPNYDLGTAHGTIKIDYDKRGFSAARKDLEGISADFDDVGESIDSLQKKFSSLGSNLKGTFLGKQKIELEADVDTKMAEAKIGSIGKSIGPIDVPVDADTVGATAKIGAFRARESGKPINLDVDVDPFKQVFIVKSMAALGDSIRTTFSSVFSAVGTGLGVVAEAGVGAFEATAEAAGGLAGKLPNLSGMITGIAGAFLKVGAVASLIAAAGGAVYTAWGAVATAIMAVPAAISLIGAPIAAVLLGMDGIKAAAQTLKPEFEALKTAVSQTFAQGLAPVFESLKQIFPTIQEQMQGVATELVSMAGSLAKVVIQADKMGVLDQIFTNVRNGILQLSLAADHLAGAFLRLASNPAAMGAIVEPIKQFAVEFDKLVAKLDDSGVLTEAFKGLEDVLKSCVDLVLELVGSGIETFAAAAPGVTAMFEGIAEFVSKIDTKALGTAMGGVFKGIGDIFKSIPKSTIDAMIKSIGDLGVVLQSPAFQNVIVDVFALISKGAQGFVDLLRGAADVWAMMDKVLTWQGPAFLGGGKGGVEGSDTAGTAPGDATPPGWEPTGWSEKAGQTKIIPKGAPEVGGNTPMPGDEITGGGADPAQLQAVQAAAAAAQTAVTALGAAIAAVVLQATTGFGSIGLSITTSLGGASVAITTFGTTVSTAFATAFLGATVAVTTGMLGITLAISTGILGITTAVTVGMAGLGIVITTSLAMAFVGAAVAATTGFLGLGLAFTTGILGLGLAITVGLAGLGIAITTGIGLMFIGAGLAVTTGFIGVGVAFTTGIIGLGVAITAGFAGLGIAITTAIAASFVGAAGAVSAGFIGVGTAVSVGVAAVTLAIKALGPAIKIAFDLAFAGLADGVKTGMDAAVVAVQTGVTAISTEVAKVGTIVGDAVKEQDWAAVGQSICDGILEGVKKGWPKLEQAVKQLAASLFAAAMSGIQAGSPSKLFALVGKFMMQGWLKGIVKNAGALIKAVGSIIMQVMGMFGFGGGGPKQPPPPPPPPAEPSTGWGWNPKARPTGASWKQDEFLKGPINITIDAQTVAEMNGVVDFFNTVQQTARAGRSS